MNGPQPVLPPTPKWELVTPELAREMLSNNNGNRPIKTDPLAQYTEDMKGSRWFHGTCESIKFDKNGTLIDGQHRLTAIVDSGEPTWMLVQEGLDPEAYRYFDRGAKRSFADTLHKMGKKNRSTISGASILILEVERNRIRKSLQGNPVKDESQALQYEFVASHPELDEIAPIANKLRKAVPGLAPSAAAAAIYLFDKKDKSMSRKFFQDILDRRLSGPTDPKVVAERALQKLKDDGKSNPRTQLWILIRAWNAMRLNKTVKRINPINVRTGEPYDWENPI